MVALVPTLGFAYDDPFDAKERGVTKTPPPESDDRSNAIRKKHFSPFSHFAERVACMQLHHHAKSV